MSIKKKARRIDLDTEEHIYHLKVNSLVNTLSALIRNGGNYLPMLAAIGLTSISLAAPCLRWSPRTGLMRGFPNCAIIGCIVRMKLWGHPEMQVFTYFHPLPQLSPLQRLTFPLWMGRYDCPVTSMENAGEIRPTLKTHICRTWKEVWFVNNTWEVTVTLVSKLIK